MIKDWFDMLIIGRLSLLIPAVAFYDCIVSREKHPQGSV